MSDLEEEKLKEKILTILEQNPSEQEYRPKKLFWELEGQDYDSYQIREALWYLIDRQKVELTSHLGLKLRRRS